MISSGELQEQRCWCIMESCHQPPQALEGASLAPGNQETLNMLRDESRRPPRLRDPLPEELLNFVPEDSFQLDEDKFCRNLRSARRGAAGGPSGMTTEHLRPLLDDVRGMRLLSCLNGAGDLLLSQSLMVGCGALWQVMLSANWCLEPLLNS